METDKLSKKNIFFESLMGIFVIVALCVIFYLIIENREPKTDKHYINLKGKIVSMGEESGKTRDKFHTPTQFHTLLIQNSEDTTLYMEWETTSEKYYNYYIGDTVNFDYISKSRWFHIKHKP